MRKRTRVITGLLVGALLLPLLAASVELKAEEEKRAVDIMFTHDTHSHLNSFATIFEGEKNEVGGSARLRTIIDAQRSKNPNTLVLDGGDFSMGTLVQTIYENEAPELRVMGALGYDVTTLGNHEFDYRSTGLSNMLKSAVDSGDVLPQLVVCNVDWEAMEEAGLSEGQQMLAEGFAEYGIKDYVGLDKGGVDIAVIGVFGADALECAPTCELIFEDPVEAVKETVAQIRETEDVDMIVCVSHSGTWGDKSKSEDEILAKSVPDLDLIVSGHTHTRLSAPMVYGDTYIVSAGEYAKWMGSISMVQKADGRWEVSDYELIPVTADIPADVQTQQIVDSFMQAVDTGYLHDFGYTREQVLATNDIAFATLADLEFVHTEHNLGDIIADAYVHAVEGASDYDGVPVDLAVVPSGTIRDTYTTGEITVENVFDSFSLGIGPDGVPGYPLVSVYLTGEELKTAAEIDASVSDYMTTARLYMSGMNFAYNPNRLILNRVTDCYLVNPGGGRVEIEDDKLYRVVADLYSGQMLSAVTDMSFGLLSLVPKYADGTKVEDFEDTIVMVEGKGLKAWQAIAGYMESFPDTDGDGIANVPAYYGELHGRKEVWESRSPVDLLKNPNKYAAMFFAAAVILIIIVVLVIVLPIKLVKRIRGRDGERRSRDL